MVEIYTDGSCKNNGIFPNEGTFAFLILENNKIVEQYSLLVKNTSNNRMEISAIMMSLLHCFNNYSTDTNIILYSDSEYVLKVLSGEYKYNKNKDLFINCFILKNKFKNLKLQWVRGHNGNHYNEIVDKLCKKTYSITK